nr:MAG TPA: hypothetical protein [Caudoviricetes sp.]
MPDDAIGGVFFATPSPGISKEILGLGVRIISTSNRYNFETVIQYKL